jgi:hypothetical protein
MRYAETRGVHSQVRQRMRRRPDLVIRNAGAAAAPRRGWLLPPISSGVRWAATRATAVAAAAARGARTQSASVSRTATATAFSAASRASLSTLAPLR